MTILTRVRALALAGLAATTVLAASPALAAPDYPLDASGIQQTVLRAQPPRTLGAWQQNIYFSNPGGRASVCYAADGAQVRLPKAKSGGGVGYAMGDGITGSAGLFQYASQSAADAALAALRSASCPDSTKVKTDVGTVVKGEQSTDFTASGENGVASIVSYRYDGGAGVTQVVEIRTTTQLGLGVVQTEITLSGDAATTRMMNRALDMNRRWHAQAVAAYEAFGSGGSR